MSLDLVVNGATVEEIIGFSVRTGLFVSDGEDGYKARNGLIHTPWMGSGRFVTAPAVDPVADDAGAIVSEGVDAQFADGVWYLLRSFGGFRKDDAIPPSIEPDAKPAKVWDVSKTAKMISDQGVSGERFGKPYRELYGIKVFTYSDIMSWCDDLGVAGHAWQ